MNALFNEVVAYLNQQKSWGKKEVFRTAIFEVMDYNRGLIKDPRDPKSLPTGLLIEAAVQVGGTYINNKGRARVVFN